MDEKVIAVQEMQNYIEDHLNDDITWSELSSVSNFSPWYSYRLFKEYTGLSFASYIRKYRLSKSAMKLKNDDVKIVDLAFDYGFESADGYTRAFYKEFSCNPMEYSKSPRPIPLFVPYGVKFKYIKEKKEMKNVSNVFIQVIKKPRRKVIIKRGIKATHYFDYCQEVGCDTWGVLLSMDSLDGEPVCLWLPKRYIKPNTSTYVQGVEVEENYSGPIPEGYDVIELEECEYLMFQGEPFEEEDFEDAIMNVQNSIKKYNVDFIGYKWDDNNPRIQLEPKGERGYIELMPIKRK